jgi:spore coat protein A, manganese oxidase
MSWYHDHTFGTTRLNAYAGIASAYVIFDDYELNLVKEHNLPGPLDPRTVYMVFQDKIFVSDNIDQIDPSWKGVMPKSRTGDLWYPHKYEKARWEIGEHATKPMPAVSCVPEFFGDTILVNGTVYPYMEVEQQQYRIRMLNACGARFLNPHLVYARGGAFPDNSEPGKAAGPGFVQIGNEGGFLPRATAVNSHGAPKLILAPGERADLIVDFRYVPDGSILLLCGDLPAPYPMGDPINDYFTGNADNPTQTLPGFGPNTRTLMQFRVKKRVGAAGNPVSLPATFTPTDPFLAKQLLFIPTPVPAGVKTRYVTLNETHDEFGRLIQMLGTGDKYTPTSMDPSNIEFDFARPYMADPTEVIPEGTQEVWEIINLTGDTHPIHFHLVNVQILSRQPINAENYKGGKPTYTGLGKVPDWNEMGWKETVRVNPNEVTRVLMQFNLPKVPFVVPESPRTGGMEYVWHCHILEHEEHDMMRPLIVTPKPK